MISKKILYIGNKVLKRGLTPTTVDTLSPLLSEIYDVKSISDKKNILLRMIDIIFTIIKLTKKIDFIIVDTYSTKNFYVALIVAFLSKTLKIKYITYLHGGDLPKRVIKNPKMSDFIFKGSYINIAPSDYIGIPFKEKLYKTKIIPNNIDLTQYPFQERGNLRPNLLYVRAFEKTYNPLMAIKVLKVISERYPNCSLCMVGPDKDGSLNDVKELVEKLNLSKNVKFTGKISKKEWIELSKDYDVFINTTNSDNQPVSVIEAMSLGFPVVSTNVGGLPFLINDQKNGFLVSIDSVDEMSNKILELLDNSLLSNKISREARKKAEEFDWKNIKEKWRNIIDAT